MNKILFILQIMSILSNCVLQFSGAHGGCASLHHDEAAGVIRQTCGVRERRAGCERKCKRRDDCIACAGDVDGLLRAHSRNVNWGGVTFQ